jgi:thioesterase domain-containing protein/acyl carrier protein
LNRDDPDKAYIAPRSDLERKLVEIWEAMLGVKPIGIRDNFFELGGHSLMEVRLVGEIEKKLGLTLPLTSLYYARTIERLAKMLEQKGAGNSLVIPGRTEGRRAPIFSHGGSTHLADHLGDDQPIYWLQVYGGDGSRVAGSIEEAAVHYLSEIRKIQPHGPYCLMGYCLGALMIFEIAQQLLRQGEKVALLALIDPAIPSLRQADAQNRAAKEPANCSSKRSGFYRRLNGLLQFKTLPAKLRARTRWAGKISRRWLSERWLDSGRRLPLFLRDFYLVETGDELIQRYVPTQYPGPAIIFRSLSDGTEEEWRRVIPDGEFHNTWVDHNEFLEEPYVETLVAEIKNHLTRAETMVPVAAPKGSMTPGLYSQANPTQSRIDDG